jgi:hypothetical protein
MEDYLLKQGRVVESEIRVRRPLFKLLIGLGVCLALGGMTARSAELSPAKLRALIDRSDLIVVASTSTICEGYIGEGPIGDGIHPTPEYREWCFRSRSPVC